MAKDNTGTAQARLNSQVSRASDLAKSREAVMFTSAQCMAGWICTFSAGLAAVTDCVLAHTRWSQVKREDFQGQRGEAPWGAKGRRVACQQDAAKF